ncbi:TPA: JAB domain-containing protein [Enterococcus faecium]|nr:JAB domain-containing protein [Enterococcus faecium]
MKIIKYETRLEASETDIPMFNKDISKITNRYEASYLCYQLLKNKPKEELLVIFLGLDNQVLGYEIVGIGTDTQVISTSKTVFSGAIKANATHIVVAHNHIMNSSVEPSQADIKAMKIFKQQGEIIGIQVVGNFIVNNIQEFYTLDSSYINDNDNRINKMNMVEKNKERNKKQKRASVREIASRFFYMTVFQFFVVLVIALLLGVAGIYNWLSLVTLTIVISSLVLSVVSFLIPEEGFVSRREYLIKK